MTRPDEHGIILYGPPAAGKDTVGEALTTLNPRCLHFPPLKAGPGRKTSYRRTTTEAVSALRAAGEVIWQHRRYGALYVIDRPALTDRLHQHVPVLHLGHPDAIDAVAGATPAAWWLIVQLWCDRDVAEHRLRERRAHNVDERLRIWDTTPRLDAPQLTINTAECPPAEAAHLINSELARCRAQT